MPHCDLLVFGPHPDDIEIGMGATVALHVEQGRRVVLCDLTRGEMGSNGSPEIRIAEANEAARVLGVAERCNLGLPDRGLVRTPGHVAALVDVIRRYRPRTVAAPYWSDRHPDHVDASALVTEAVFNSGLRRIQTARDAWRPAWTCYYFINDSAPASFVIDVSGAYARKHAALACYASQLQPGAGAVATRLNSPNFGQLVHSRDAQFGALVGVPYAEGFVVREPVMRGDLLRDLPSPTPANAGSAAT